MNHDDDVDDDAIAASSSLPPSPREERCRIRGVWGTYAGTFNSDRQRHGVGTMRWDDGSCYEGEWRNGEREGRGTIRWASGFVALLRYRSGVVVGEGVMWSKDGKTAWRLVNGIATANISLRRAEEFAALIGLPVPRVDPLPEDAAAAETDGNDEQRERIRSAALGEQNEN